MNLNRHVIPPLAAMLFGCQTSPESRSPSREVPGCDRVFVAGEDDREAIQTALIEVGIDATLCFSGRFELETDRLTAQDKVRLTLRGIDEGEAVGSGAVFDFGGTVGPTGFKFANLTGVTLENFSVLDVAGDGIEVRGSTDVTLRQLRISYPETGKTTNGAYGVYPVESTNVLVEGCEVENASDAGIYVGQSKNIVVRNNLASGNVSGVQVENSINTEIVGNTTFNNTVGIFVHDIPGVPAGNGKTSWVHDNETYGNNTPNFAPGGIIAKYIPSGVGVLVMAADHVEVSNNTLHDNQTTGLLLISFKLFEFLDAFENKPDPEYDPYPETIFIHDNEFADNGSHPDALFVDNFGLSELPDITWDGFTDPDKDPADGLRICIRNNLEASFRNMDVPGGGTGSTTELTAHDCEQPALGPVNLDPAN
ncbi:MAG: parallel beta-helix domain-containing protein [Nannocystaceae bacterium]